MSDKDINIHVKATDTEQTKEKIGSVETAVKKYGEAVNRTKQQTDEASKKQQEFNENFKKSKEETDRAGQSQEEFGKKTKEGLEAAGGKVSFLSQQLGSLKNMFLGAFGVVGMIGAVTSAIRMQSEAMKEHAQIALNMQNKLLRLQFLGDFYKEKPELRKQVMGFAEYGRRPFEEVANAWYNLRSKSSASLTNAQQEALMREALEYGITDPNAPLDTLVDMFSLYAKQTKDKNANRIQNVIRETITQAGGSTAQTAQYMPQFLPIGMTGGLSGPEAAGIWAYITTQFAEPSIATTGLRSVFMALQGKGTPQSQQLLSKLGVKGNMNFFEKIKQLSKKQSEGKLDLSAAETIAQKEGAPALLLLTQNTDAMMKSVSAIVGAYNSQEDLTRNAIENLVGADEIANLEDLSRFLNINIQNIKGMDKRALRLEVGKKFHEAYLRKTGVSELAIGIETKMDNLVSAVLGRTLFGWENLSDSEMQKLLGASGSASPGSENSNPVVPSFLESQPWQKKRSAAQPLNGPVNITHNNDNSINIYPSIGQFEPNRIDFNE